MDETRQQLVARAGLDHGRRWQAERLEAVGTPAAYPGRCPVARENRLFRRQIRQLIYRKLHRILFTVVEDTEDAPFVFVLHVRHGARRPMTRREARDIKDESES